jgi:broad-specificity NMP kinase
MKLIFIYGPPASGKLTVAEKLSDMSGISLFHNHLSRDLVKDIYKDNLLEHYDLVYKIRLDVFEYCATNGTDLIFTYVYAGKEDDNDVRSFMDVIKNNGGEVVFVGLTANREDLIDRVDNESRKKYKKLMDKSIMNKITEDMEQYIIPFVDSLRINTSKLDAQSAARLIKEHID